MNFLTPFLRLSFFRSVMVLSLIGNTAFVYAESADDFMTDELDQEIKRNLQHRSELNSVVEHNNNILRSEAKENSSNNSENLNQKLFGYMYYVGFTNEGGKKIVEEGANINASSHDGTTPLILSISKSRDSDDDYQKFAHYLLTKGANPNLIQPPNKVGDYTLPSKTALIEAVDNTCNINIIKDLLEHDADANIRDSRGNNPLFYAMYAGNDCSNEVISLLVKKSDIKAKTDALYTSLDNKNGIKFETVKMLVESGIAINAVNDNGELPIDITDDDQIKELFFSNGSKLPTDATTNDMILYLKVKLFDYLYYIITIIVLAIGYRQGRKYLRDKKRALLVGKVTKAKECTNGIYDRVMIIDCEYLPEHLAKREQFIAQVVDLKNLIHGLDGKEDAFEEKSFNKELENLDKEIERLKQEVESLHNAVQSAVETISQIRGMLHDTENSFKSLEFETSEYLDFSAVKPLHKNVSTLLEEINNLNHVIEATNDYKAMRAFIDRYENDILNLYSKVDSLRSEWESAKQDLKEYKSLLDRMKKLYNGSEKNYEYCRSISGNEDAKRLEPLFDTIRMSAKPLIDAIMNQQKINREEITALETQFNEYNREFETQLKAVVEFKQLPNDRAKKEWILKNGYLSWFFDDTTIAEKFREFDDMEEKFKYLIKASEKLRFLDLEKERKDEGKTTWLVFMNEIKSDMSYDKLKEFMRAWQTDAKFKGISDQWKKKLNESNIDDKKLLTITTKFIGMKF
jgi:ankyrin repeat protein/uncharacterized coiled-coil DUF342 family protein